MKLWKYNALLLFSTLFVCFICHDAPKEGIFFQISNEKRVEATSASTTQTDKQIKYTLKNKENKELNKALLKKSKEFKKCLSKKGVLSYVTKHPKKGKTIIKSISVFVSLNLDSIMMFRGIEKNLLDSVKIDNIQRITYHYTGTHCFNIIVNTTPNKDLHIKPLTLCAKSQKQMSTWVNTIMEFKHCKLQNSSSHPGKVIVDFSKVNTVNKKDPLSDLYYNNTRSVYHEAPKVEGHTEFHQSVGTILATVHKGEIAHKRTKRQLQAKLRAAKNFTEHVRQKEEKIREMLRNNAMLAKSREDHLIKAKQQTKEMRILKETEEKLRKLKKAEIMRSKLEYNARIREEKEKATRRTQQMIKTIMEQDKLENYHICHANKLYSNNLIT